MDPRRGNGESGGHLTPYLDSSKRWKAPLWSRAWSLKTYKTKLSISVGLALSLDPLLLFWAWNADVKFAGATPTEDREVAGTGPNANTEQGE